LVRQEGGSLIDLEKLEAVVTAAKTTDKLDHHKLFSALLGFPVTGVKRQWLSGKVMYTVIPERPNTIVLTEEERALADEHGRKKNDASEAAGQKADWYDDKGGSVLKNHQDGAAGEIAYFQWRAFPVRLTIEQLRPLLTINNFKGADAGRNTEVRTTKQTWFGLKVKDRDRDERIAIAWRQVNRLTFTLLGWKQVADAKKIGEKKDPGDRGKPAYFVKDADLNPISALPEEKL